MQVPDAHINSVPALLMSQAQKKKIMIIKMAFGRYILPNIHVRRAMFKFEANSRHHVRIVIAVRHVALPSRGKVEFQGVFRRGKRRFKATTVLAMCLSVSFDDVVVHAVEQSHRIKECTSPICD